VDGDLDLDGIDISPEDMKELMKSDPAEWRAEIPDIERHLASFGSHLPERLRRQLDELVKRLG